jgi:hypothetical protein
MSCTLDGRDLITFSACVHSVDSIYPIVLTLSATGIMPSQRSVRIPFPKKGDVDSDDDAGEITAPGKQCLPMASLPGDFSGDPEDGAQYLAMMQ